MTRKKGKREYEYGTAFAGSFYDQEEMDVLLAVDLKRRKNPKRKFWPATEWLDFFKAMGYRRVAPVNEEFFR